MASYIGSPLGSTTRPSSKNGTTRVCPDCSGLECLCRPRFFAGQLLTEQEFNRLDRYIVEKNKLHNRYLHGWGVVCGLDVQCDGCGGGVIVKTGYALSPCGEDIIVCSDTAVDICALINQCQKKTQPECGATNTNDGCQEATQDWVLAICYSETASRGVMPLRGGSSGGCGCGCGCGGKKSASSSTNSGCGCGGKSSSTAASKCAPPLQCEPTVLCEGYSFCVYPAPSKANVRGDKNNATKGALPARFQACLENLVDSLPSADDYSDTNQGMHDWVYAAKSALASYVRDNPVYDCQLSQKIGAIVCPAVSLSTQDFQSAFKDAKEQLLLIALELMLACMCRALQPPCPDPVMDDCVPLAVITVQNKDTCKVTSICNWTALRKYVMTFPNLQYWLSIFPFGRMLREALENFCCKAIRQFEPRAETPSSFNNNNNNNDQNLGVQPDAETVYAKKTESQASSYVSPSDGSPSTAFQASAQTATRSRQFMHMALGMLSSVQTSMDAESLTLGLLGEKNADQQPYLTAEQSDNVMQFLVMDQLAKPALRTLMPKGLDTLSSFSNLAGMMSMMGAATDSKASSSVPTSAPAGAPSAAAAGTPNLDFEARFNAQFKALNDTVQKQQTMIDQLTAQLKVPTDATKRSNAKKRNE